jgi:sugar/nucleoside kinase (ribokinase family)
MNENEAGWFARALSPSDTRWEDVVHHEERWLEAATFVSRETGVGVDLHTPHLTASIREQRVTAIPTFVAVPRVVCGSGDSWNAGDVYGILSGLNDHDRLTLANSVAALYISSEEATHPSVSDVETFLERKPNLSPCATNLLNSP